MNINLNIANLRLSGTAGDTFGKGGQEIMVKIVVLCTVKKSRFVLHPFSTDFNFYKQLGITGSYVR